MHATEVPNEHPARQFEKDAIEQLRQARTSKKYALVRCNLIRSAEEFFGSSGTAEKIRDALPETYEAFRKIHSDDHLN